MKASDLRYAYGRARSIFFRARGRFDCDSARLRTPPKACTNKAIYVLLSGD